MKPDQVSFRLHDGIDVCEIRLPDGNVGVFPANEVIPGSDPVQTYAERYKPAFDAYKAGELQPFEVAALDAAAASEGSGDRGAVSDVETAGSARKRKPAKKAKAKKAPAKKAAKAKKK